MDRVPHDKESLRPMLHEAHESLEDALDEACASKPAEQETTGEMIRLEESLSLAAEAAKRAVSIRRRLHEERDRVDRDDEGPRNTDARGP